MEIVHWLAVLGLLLIVSCFLCTCVYRPCSNAHKSCLYSICGTTTDGIAPPKSVREEEDALQPRSLEKTLQSTIAITARTLVQLLAGRPGGRGVGQADTLERLVLPVGVWGWLRV